MKTPITYSLLICFLITSFFIKQATAQVLITDIETGIADPSAMLEIRSTDKGLLIPRMTTIQRNSISNAQDGLLVYDTDQGSFYIFGRSSTGEPAWNDLSKPSEIWQTGSSNVYLSSSYTNLGIGTGNPSGKLVIKADAGKAPDDALLEIQDANGRPVFVVTSEGARLYINGFAKGSSGGFAVGRYGIAKGIPDTTYFMVSPDSTRVYTDDAAGASGGFAVGRYGIAKDKKNYYFFTGMDSTRVYANEGMKGSSGGFAVGRYGIAKGMQDYSFYTAKDSTRVYTDDLMKGSSGGFAVGRYGIAKGDKKMYFMTNLDSTTINVMDSVAGFNVINVGRGKEEKFMYMTTENSFIGHESGLTTVPGSGDIGKYNSFIGYQTGFLNEAGNRNVFIGHQSGYSNKANCNVFIGSETGYSNNNGSFNLFMGYRSGWKNTDGAGNLFLGYQAGRDNTTGDRNVFIGYTSGLSTTDADNNLFIGFSSGTNNKTGSNNIYLGTQSGQYDTTGNNNVFIGYQTGRMNRNGSKNVFIGYQAGMNELGGDKLYINNGSESTPLIWGDFVGKQLGFYGNVCIGGNANGGGTRVLALVNGTVPNASVTDGVLLYTQDVSTSELRVRDEAGNITTLSPHNFSLIPQSEPMAWSYYSENSQTGQVINVDMLKAVRIIENLSGQKLVYMNNTTGLPAKDPKKDGPSIQTLLENLQKTVDQQQQMLEKLSNENDALKKELDKLKIQINK
jgi:hypothetical protein